MKACIILLCLWILSCEQRQDSDIVKKEGSNKCDQKAISIDLDIDSNDTPMSLDEGISYFITKWSDKEKEQFRNEQEYLAVSHLHLTVGMFIRNFWIRHGRGNEALRNEFKEIGIFHPDDISSIILRSLHRKLNNIPIDLGNQTKPYIQYWNEIANEERLADKVSIQTYDKFQVGDKIKIFMYVDTMEGQRNACIVQPKDEWTFNPRKDLLITGILKNKYFVEDKKSSFFIVGIRSMNFDNTTVFMDSVYVNTDHEFSIRNLRIE